MIQLECKGFIKGTIRFDIDFPNPTVTLSQHNISRFATKGGLQVLESDPYKFIKRGAPVKSKDNVAEGTSA
jgi:hypothetical protein